MPHIQDARGPEMPVRTTAWKPLVAAFLIGAVIGAFGCFFVQAYNPPDASGRLASVVFGRIVEQNELVSVSQKYQITDKVTDSNKLFGLDIPFTQNSFWYRYEGMLKAGVNLADAEFDLQGTTITVSLAQPYIISNTPDMDASGVLEENNNTLNPIHVEDIDAFLRECAERSRSEAIAGGLLDEARTNAEDDIRSMFLAALGDTYTVEFVWRDGADEGGGSDTDEVLAEKEDNTAEGA